ncbi:amidohydrolase family protein [Elusimicrobiota bacterium]
MKRSLLIFTCILALSFNLRAEEKDKPKEKPLPLPLQKQLMPAKDPALVTKSPCILIRAGHIMTVAGKTFDNGHLLMKNGRIQSVGEGRGKVPVDCEIINAPGKYVTPGLIDIHSHIGVYAMPNTNAHDDGNEAINPNTAYVNAEHAFWPQDPAIWRAIAGGITTIQVFPGSANLVGGLSFIAKLKPAVSAREMRFPGASPGMKMACGENPKNFYKKKGPSSRMGNVAGFRDAFQKAREYGRKLQKYDRDLVFWKERVKKAGKNIKKLREIGDPPKLVDRNFTNENLARVLNGEMFAHMHCYRADDMSALLDLAHEYGFKIRSFQHSVEAYKIRHRLAKEQTAATTWSDWWGFKMEAFDGIPYNLAMLEDAGAIGTLHSDSPIEIRHLNQEAGKAMTSGKKIGIDVSDEQALAWVTKNPAKVMGIDNDIGTLESGKMADVVVWNRHPLSVYAHTEKVFIDGIKVFDRDKEDFHLGDFEIGIRNISLADGRKLAKHPGELETFKNTPSEDLLKKTLLKDNSFIIENARVEIGNGTSLAKASVVIKNGRIAYVGDSPRDIPAGRIDAKGKVLTPGLIESMSQLGLFEVGSEESTVDFSYKGKSAAPAFRAIDGFNPASIRIAIAREEGITSAIANPRGALLKGTGFMFDLTQDPLNAVYPKKDIAMFGNVSRVVAHRYGKSRASLWLNLREIISDVEFYKKNRKAVEQGKSRRLALSPIHLEAMIPVLEGKIPLVLSARSENDIRSLIQFKKDLKEQGHDLRLMIHGAHEAWGLAKQIADANIPVLFTPSQQLPSNFDMLKARDDSPALLHAAGIPLILSAYSWDNNMRRLRQEAGIAVSYGLDHAAAIRAITLAPAEVYGVADEIGSIEKGKRANLVLWSGDPFETSTVAQHIWIDGKEMPLTNRQRQLADRYMGE